MPIETGTKIVIHMDGGIIHAAYSNDPTLEIEIVDEDLAENGEGRKWEDSDAAGLTEIPATIINRTDWDDVP